MLRRHILTKKNMSLLPHGDFGGHIDTLGTATCTDCHQVKNNAEFMFYKNRVNPDTKLCLYVNKKCKSCRQTYQVGKQEAEAFLKTNHIARPVPSLERPYPCDCCHKPIVTTRTIQLDHCHRTNEFRGWLCKECNISMGNLGDNIVGFLRAIKYLNRTEKRGVDELQAMLRDVLTEP